MYNYPSQVVAICLCCVAIPLFAQEEGYYPRIHIEDEVPNPVEIKKKRIPPNVFLGLKTKKKQVRSGYGKRRVRERFRVLRKPPESLLPYVQTLYFYDKEKKTIRKTGRYAPEKGPLLHGKYKKISGKQLLQSGYFYKGALHGRWEIHNKKNILLDKKKFHKGWAYDAAVLYYDPKRQKVRQIMPVHHGEREGRYYAFHENGRLAVQGKYRHDVKVDMWKEYYKNGKEKRRIQYARNPFDTEYTPTIVIEWDEKGDLLYDRGEYLRSIR